MQNSLALKLVLLLVLIGGGIAAYYLYPGTTEQRLRLQAENPEIVARGEAIYVEHCAACHGVNLEGQPNWRTRGPDGLLPAPPHDPSGHTWHHPDDVLIAFTKYGPAQLINDPTYQSAMPAYEGILSDEDIVAVLSYIKSTWPADLRRQHDQMNDALHGQ